MMPTTRATVLFAHGSRDPAWSRPIEAVAQHMLAMEPACLVRCAYLELTSPDLPTVVDALIAGGVRDITIVPMFLGVGRHAREDLPLLVAQLSASYPQHTIRLRPAIGEDARVIDLLARIALD
jgi:sirohydrochlorin cobaltochelatase